MPNFTCLYPFDPVRKQVGTRFRSRIRIGSSYLISFIFLAAMTIGLASCTLDAVQSEVYFVKETADSGGDGESWETAFTHPQDALDVAGAGDQIWVAEGVYGPRNDGNRNVIALKAGVQVMGGFTGVESNTAQRSPEMAITVLDGQGFAYHVVSAVGADEAVLDGLIITNGNASGSGMESDNGGEFTGGGIFNVYSSLEIRQCRFFGNAASYKGGAIYNEESSPLVVDCIFEKNSALFGGAVYNFFSSPTTINSIFRENESHISGGAVANFTSFPTYVNSLFSGNQTTYTGGAILSNSGSAIFSNCTFTGNRSQEKPGGEVSFYKGSAKLINCILWGDVSSDFPEICSDDGDIEIGFSIIQGGYAGTGNLDLAPDFVQDGFWNGEGHWVDGDYRLTEGSPAIDRGTAEGAPNFDLAGRLRPQSFAHDLGAYEHTSDSSL